jgi:hypothetical protein
MSSKSLQQFSKSRRTAQDCASTGKTIGVREVVRANSLTMVVRMQTITNPNRAFSPSKRNNHSSSLNRVNCRFSNLPLSCFLLVCHPRCPRPACLQACPRPACHQELTARRTTAGDSRGESVLRASLARSAIHRTTCQIEQTIVSTGKTKSRAPEEAAALGHTLNRGGGQGAPTLSSHQTCCLVKTVPWSGIDCRPSRTRSVEEKDIRLIDLLSKDINYHKHTEKSGPKTPRE